MDTILQNVIKEFIGRFPSEEELKSAKEHIDFYCGEDTLIEEIKGSIIDWLDDKMVECQNCGKWHLRNDVEIRNGFYFCDNDCADEYEDSTYDMHAEAKAEYYATHK